MNSDILIFGKGFIGTRLQEGLDCAISGKKIFRLADAQEEIANFKPKVIINCIGHIGRNVDDCEADIDLTLSANVFAPLVLAEAALRNRIKFIQISSGCIFHYDYGKNVPIDETKDPDFFGLFYSRTKIYSEQAIRLLCGKFPVLIVRIRVPLDNRPGARNLIDKLAVYKKAIDLPNSVTYIPDFISAMKHLLKIDASGIYNVVNKGGLYYPRLLDVYKKYVPDFQYETIEFKKLNSVRTNLILSTKKLEDSGFIVRHVNDVLEECVSNYIVTTEKLL
ncbi:MAG: sugar nucleotide-binding protein [Candidatus Omnitrophota bacterium]